LEVVLAVPSRALSLVEGLRTGGALAAAVVAAVVPLEGLGDISPDAAGSLVTSLLENILVSLSLTDVFSGCFGCPSALRSPLGLAAGWPFSGLSLGDRVGNSTDLIDEGCEAGGVVFSEALVIIEELDVAGIWGAISVSYF